MRYSDVVIKMVDAWLIDHPGADRDIKLKREQRRFERARNNALRVLLRK